MAAAPKTPLARQAQLLSEIVRMLRKERHMTQEEVAVAMGVSLRTYRDFEKGRRAYDFNKVRLFAKATRSDAAAIHLGVQFNWPELPLLLMDNKMATAFYVLTRDLFAEFGPRLSRVPAATWVAGFRHIAGEIRKLFERQDASVDDYIARAIELSYEDPDGGLEEG
ncbi:helix-turn-helix transcriptional regulator [Caulobacter sp. UNC279MFTsu5.1]|uniref:helix-turn-helix domain-containing protein n=1 Tax=Caulobacter sp. UNC279MFTsu5.1 TaxID=1502775 RepID=UPI0008F0CEBF|nr:helix-turn-helix transcriptional regulator [Caulobacter sp. UNC279MFTsu5.1]SFI51792.1 Helix-turn-helix [Caulobacter sp. UNC279MFTsu5.1]